MCPFTGATAHALVSIAESKSQNLLWSRAAFSSRASVMAKQWNVLLDLKVVDGPNKGEKTERKCRVTLAWDKTWSSIGFMAPVTRLCNDRRAGICSRKNNYSSLAAELVSSSSQQQRRLDASRPDIFMIYKKIKKAEKRVIVQYYCCTAALAIKKRRGGGGREYRDTLFQSIFCSACICAEEQKRKLFVFS